MKVRANRVLVSALVLSACVHFAFAVSVRPMPAIAAREEPPPQRFSIERRPPPPTPKPTLPPPKSPQRVAVKAVHSPRSAPFRPHVVTTTNGRSAPVEPPVVAKAPPADGISEPGPAMSAAPAATEIPKPSCSTPFAPAVATDPVAATIPDGFEGDNAVAQIRVTLDAAGKVTEAAVFRSAGNVLLDRAAIAAARMSRYRPEIRDCEPAGGSYLFTVEFQS